MNETGAAPGWYADPMRRYEHRYYNGREWTADVATGGQRFVDQLGLEPTGGAPAAGSGTPHRSGTNAAATTAMVLGIVAVSIAWLPFLVVLGALAAVLAIVFGVIGLRRSRVTGTGRSFAVAGLTTAVAALAAAVIGVVLTGIVLEVYDDYLNPEPNEVDVTSCELQGARATMTGEITNTGDRVADYSVLVGFVRPGTDNTHRTERVDVDDVAPGATSEFTAQSQVDLDDIDCIVVEVNGPLPFGITVD
ncbi:MAG: DUF2510 domain-containing protein [Ilumatobacteraceae bacterium]|jgi:hypothetical protein